MSMSKYNKMVNVIKTIYGNKIRTIYDNNNDFQINMTII